MRLIHKFNSYHVASKYLAYMVRGDNDVAYVGETGEVEIEVNSIEEYAMLRYGIDCFEIGFGIGRGES